MGKKYILRPKQRSKSVVHMLVAKKLKEMGYKIYIPKPPAPSDTICNHCGLPIKIGANNPVCDHLWYPENCETCKKPSDTTETKGGDV